MQNANLFNFQFSNSNLTFNSDDKLPPNLLELKNNKKNPKQQKRHKTNKQKTKPKQNKTKSNAGFNTENWEVLR